MAGIEVIGVLAGVGQLIQLSGAVISGLHDLYKRAHGASERYSQQTNQIEQLIHTANLIADTEALNTPLVARHLQTLLDTVRSLHQTLAHALNDASRKRYWKVIWSTHREEKISRGFLQLEENKSSLVLCILGTYGGIMMPAVQKTGECVKHIEGDHEEARRSRAKPSKAHSRSVKHTLSGGVSLGEPSGPHMFTPARRYQPSLNEMDEKSSDTDPLSVSTTAAHTPKLVQSLKSPHQTSPPSHAQTVKVLNYTNLVEPQFEPSEIAGALTVTYVQRPVHPQEHHNSHTASDLSSAVPNQLDNGLGPFTYGGDRFDEVVAYDDTKHFVGTFGSDDGLSTPLAFANIYGRIESHDRARTFIGRFSGQQFKDMLNC